MGEKSECAEAEIEMTPFEKGLSFLLRPDIEGGMSTDPDDPGNWTGGAKGVGELKGTKYGISAASYPDIDIKALTPETAGVIYQKDYWAVCKCGELPSPLAIVVFDSAVNQGTNAAVRLLQEALGVTVDGVIGPQTIKAAQSAKLQQSLPYLVAARALRYATTKNVGKYGKGWFRRLAACHQAALEPL